MSYALSFLTDLNTQGQSADHEWWRHHSQADGGDPPNRQNGKFENIHSNRARLTFWFGFIAL